MPDDQLPYLLGYPASFCVTADEARGNILRMIEAEIPGWNGGPSVWAARLREQLGRPNRTRKLNRYGAKLNAVEWVWVMRSLLMDCERKLAMAGSDLQEIEAIEGRAAIESIDAVEETPPKNYPMEGSGEPGLSFRDPDPDGPLRGATVLPFPHRVSA